MKDNNSIIPQLQQQQLVQDLFINSINDEEILENESSNQNYEKLYKEEYKKNLQIFNYDSE